MLRNIVLAIASLPLSLVAQSQAASLLTAQTPVIINSPQSPLQVVSIRSTLTDMMQTVTIKNTSDRNVAGFRLGLIMAVPADCGPEQAIADERIFRSETNEVPASKTVQSENYLLSPDDLNTFGRAHAAKAVYSQVAVVYVKFTDGGSWQARTHTGMYDPDHMASTGHLQCSMAKDALQAREKANDECSRDFSKSPESVQGFSCSTNAGQSCQVAGDAQSCTESYCSNGATFCQNQGCNSHVVPVNPAPHFSTDSFQGWNAQASPSSAGVASR